MNTLHLASSSLESRQTLATGRFSEAITNRPIEGFKATLEYPRNGGQAAFAAELVTKPGGWFTLHLHPSRDLPELPSTGTVTLTLRLARDGQPDVLTTLDVPASDLALVESGVTVAGQNVTTWRIAGAPFRFMASVPPRPVTLDGLVLIDNDPEAPANTATVTAVPAAPVSTNSQGRFRVPALPVVASVTISIDRAGHVTQTVIRPDYSRAAMLATFSVPGH